MTLFLSSLIYVTVSPFPVAFSIRNMFPVVRGTFRAGSGDFPGRTSRVPQRTVNVQTQLLSGSVGRPLPAS